MSGKKPIELRVSVNMGYRRHAVAIGLPSAEVLEEFEIAPATPSPGLEIRHLSQSKTRPQQPLDEELNYGDPNIIVFVLPHILQHLPAIFAKSLM